MKKLELQYRVLGSFETNTYFLVNTDTQETIVVDPADSAEYIMKQFELRGYKMSAILLTHGHFDHIYAANQLRDMSGAKIYACEKEQRLLSDANLNRSLVWADAVTVSPDEWLKDGEERELAGLKFKVIHTPGHTEGSCCYYFEEEETLIAGDTLFCESFGRTDLPTGSLSELISSLRNKLFTLPPQTKVYPGHAEFSSIEHEIKYNPVSRSREK